MFPQYEDMAMWEAARQQEQGGGEEGNPLDNLVRGLLETEKEENSFRAQVRKATLQSPQQLYEDKIAAFRKAGKGKKASVILSEILGGISQGSKFVPLQERLKEEAQKDYQLETTRLAQANASDRAQTAETNMRRMAAQFALDQQRRKGEAEARDRQKNAELTVKRGYLEAYKSNSAERRKLLAAQTDLANLPLSEISSTARILAEDKVGPEIGEDGEVNPAFKGEYGKALDFVRTVRFMRGGKGAGAGVGAGGGTTTTSVRTSEGGVQFMPFTNPSGETGVMKVPRPPTTSTVTTTRGGPVSPVMKQMQERIFGAMENYLGPSPKGAVGLQGGLQGGRPQVGPPSYNPDDPGAGLRRKVQNDRLVPPRENAVRNAVAAVNPVTVPEQWTGITVDPKTGFKIFRLPGFRNAAQQQEVVFQNNLLNHIDELTHVLADGMLNLSAYGAVGGLLTKGKYAQEFAGYSPTLAKLFGLKWSKLRQEIMNYTNSTTLEKIYQESGKQINEQELKISREYWPSIGKFASETPDVMLQKAIAMSMLIRAGIWKNALLGKGYTQREINRIQTKTAADETAEGIVQKLKTGTITAQELVEALDPERIWGGLLGKPGQPQPPPAAAPSALPEMLKKFKERKGIK